MPTPHVDLEAFATQRVSARAAEKRGLWTGLLKLLQSHDVIEKARFCPVTLAGVAALVSRQMSEPAFLEEAYAVGLAEIGGYRPEVRDCRIETIQVTCAAEPEPDLVERLTAAGFSRLTAADARPVIHVGSGVLGEWKKAQTVAARVTRCEFPIDLVRGTTHAASDGRADPDRRRDPGEPSDPDTGGDLGADPADAPCASEAIADGVATAGGKRVYRQAVIAPPGEDGWRLHRASEAQYDALMLAVIEQQGPVDVENAIEAIRTGLNLSAIRSNGRKKLRDAVPRLLDRQAVVRTHGGFCHAAGRPIVPRDRTSCEERLRTPTAVPPVEIAAAVVDAIRDGGPDEEEAVVAAAAGRLGYTLKSPNSNRSLSERILSVVETLTRLGALVRHEGRLVLGPRSLDEALGDMVEPREPGGCEDGGRDAECIPEGDAANVDGEEHQTTSGDAEAFGGADEILLDGLIGSSADLAGVPRHRAAAA